MKQFNIKLKYRILFSPFIFIWNTFLIYGGLILPTTLLIVFSLMSLLSYPIKSYLNDNCGGNLEIDDAFFDDYGKE